jgi:hypothetical protein
MKTLGEPNVCYECDGFEALASAAKNACAKSTECTEKKDTVSVSCTVMQQKIDDAEACMTAQDKLAEACFNKGYSEKRIDLRRTASQNSAHCRDTLDFKKGKKLCR